MRGTLRLLLYGSLTVLPVAAAAVVTVLAVRFFKEDKELYVYDLSSQSVELVARNLLTRLESLALQAQLEPELASPFLARHAPPSPPARDVVQVFRIENISHPDDARLRVFPTERDDRSMDLRPTALLDLQGYQGPTELLLVNERGVVLIHRDLERVTRRESVTELVERLRLFKPRCARVGTREVTYGGQSALVAYAQVGPHLAVLQTIAREQVLAAAKPLVTSAMAAAALVALVAVILALVFGRLIIRPLRLMSQQAEAISRGDFGVAVEGSAHGEVAELVRKFNEMSAALKRRSDELQRTQRQLLQAERLNTAGRMVTAIANELTTPLEACYRLASKTLYGLPSASSLRELQHKIMEESDRASNVLQNLSRLTTREASEAQPIEPDLVLQDLLVSAKPIFAKRELKVEADLDAEAGRVLINPDHFRIALLDILLFVNDEAAAQSTLQVELKRREERIAIDIAYAGTPLTSERRELLLRPVTAGASSSVELSVAALTFHEQGGELGLEVTATGGRISAWLPASAG